MPFTQPQNQLPQNHDTKSPLGNCSSGKQTQKRNKMKTTFINSVRANYKNMSAGFCPGGLDTMSSLNYFAWSLQPRCAIFHIALPPLTASASRQINKPGRG